jgi:glycosyltransferase involved in cell wall biosynthesis
MKIALIVQPATIVSGGGQILKIIGDVISEHNEIDIVFLTPRKRNASENTILFIKSWMKIIRSSVNRTKNVCIMNVDQLSSYDKIFVGWVGDLSQLLEAGVHPERIVHICQSVETWAGDTKSACFAYSSSIERWFVADWLADSLSCITAKSFKIGNSIAELFFDDRESIIERPRPFVTHLTHPGWWKGIPECALVSEVIACRTDLKIQTFGTFKTGREQLNHLSPTPRGVMALLDETQIFVAMSLYEGMPLIAIEALARGCKLVLSDIPAHREIWKHVGDQHCQLISTPPLDFNQLYQIDWAKFTAKNYMIADYVQNFKVSAFRERVKKSYLTSIREKTFPANLH